MNTQGSHLPEEPGKPGKVREFKSGQGNVREKRKSQGKKEKSGKVCSSIWSITASIDLDTKCAKKELFTRYSCALHHMKSERRKGFSYMQVVT